MTNNHKIGYKNPPKSSRFKAGSSGNPKGRPKGKKNALDILESLDKAISASVVLPDGKKANKLDVAMMQLANKSASGSERATKLIMDIHTKYQHPKIIGKLFYEKLINENYISEKSARDYIKNITPLTLERIPTAIAELGGRVVTDKMRAWHAFTCNLYLSKIYLLYYRLLYASSIKNNMLCTKHYWDGVENALNTANLSDKQKEDIIKTLAKSYDFAKPSKALLKAAVGLHLYYIQMVEEQISILVNAGKEMPYYKEQEDDWFSDKYRAAELREAKAISTKQYQETMEAFDSLSNAYKDYNKSHSGKTKYNLTPPTQQKIKAIVKWHTNNGQNRE